ncbi:MAG: hypothetical protein II333_00705 [Clostridia bacterium]|nr:hypothetical protein [Clostridia bacterium]
MKSKVAEEIELIVGLSVGIPTISWLIAAGAWWDVEPIKVFAGYLLSVVGLALLCVAISLHDEAQKMKKGSSPEVTRDGR